MDEMKKQVADIQEHVRSASRINLISIEVQTP